MRYPDNTTPIRAEKTGWRDQALCGLGTYPAHLWFSRRVRDKKLAKEICLACPVLEQCTAYTVTAPIAHGIMAGMTPYQVLKLRKILRQEEVA